MSLHLLPDGNTLISRIRAGDQAIFYELYKTYRDSFVDWAVYNFGLIPEDARDAYQETFVALWLNIHEGRLTNLSSDIKTYIYSIGKHHILNFIKKRDRSVTSDPASLINMSYQPFDMSDDRDHNKSIVEQHLSLLPDKERRILEMYYLEDKDMKMIASELGYKSPDVAKKRKYEVFKKLAALVKDNLKSFVLMF